MCSQQPQIHALLSSISITFYLFLVAIKLYQIANLIFQDVAIKNKARLNNKKGDKTNVFSVKANL